MKRRQELKEFERKINRFDSFTRARSIVLGTVNWSLLKIISDQKKQDHTRMFLEDLDQTFNYVEKICEEFNIGVDRPIPIEYDPNKKYTTPYFELPAIKAPSSPSDSFLCLADTIVEVGSVTENAFFDYAQYRHIWQAYFDNGSKWIASPIATHNPAQLDGFEYFTWAEPLFDAPCVEPVGNVVFHSERTALNVRARLWLERTFPQFTKFVAVPNTTGHLDSYFRVLKPGVVYSSIPKSKLPEEFANWEIIHATKTQYQPPEVVSEFFQDDDYENTALDVNGWSIDENHFMLMKHVFDHHPEAIKKIESHGIECIPIPFDSSRFLGQGMSCIISATNRTGSLVNYF